MADTVPQKTRSRIMRSVGTRNTGPEVAVRKLLSSLGYRYRLHRRDLPGTPDIVFAGRRKVVFVHGCFWHGHRCRYGKLPKSKIEYWRPKIENNRKRDAKNMKSLRDEGWKAAVVWQCELRNERNAQKKLKAFLGALAKS